MEELFAEIVKRSWWKATAPSIQQRIRALPKYCKGFLEDLATRPETGGGVRIINLDALLIPDTGKIFGIFVVFRVQRLDDPATVYWYQYFSWAQGPASGSKGVLLVRRGTHVSHLITLRGFKFAPGVEVTEGFGGFGEPNERDVNAALRSFERELQEEIGVPQIRLVDVIPLGRIRVDAGMTNNYPSLFAGVISVEEMQRLPGGEVTNSDAHELRGRIVITPVEALWGVSGFAMTNDDGLTLACLMRCIALGIITPPM